MLIDASLPKDVVQFSPQVISAIKSVVPQTSIYSPVFLFGMNKDGVVVKIARVSPSGGCSQMKGIDRYEWARIQAEFVKLKLSIVGIGRIGNSFRFTSYLRGPSLSQAGKMGMWILSYHTSSHIFLIEKRENRKTKKLYPIVAITTIK